MTLNDLEQLSNKYIIPQITVDFIRDSYVNIPSKQMDNARYVLITCTENGVVKKINPLWSAFIRLKKSDENIVYNSCEVINETGQILVTLTEQILASSGKAKADIQFLTDDNTIYSTKLFYLDITETPYDSDEIVSTHEFDAFNEILANLGDSVEISKELIDNYDDWNNAEIIRQENEERRIANETSRQLSEQSRSEELNNLKGQLETTIESVDTAIEEANEATNKANEAARDCENIIAGTGFIASSEKGRANGIATLNEDGVIPMSQLPADIGTGGTIELEFATDEDITNLFT